MANRFVSSTGSNTSPYDTWAKAATNLATAITGSAAGDVFVIDAAAPGADVAADTTWTFLGNASVIASTNSGTSTITPTTMGTAAWLGASGGTSYSVSVAGAFRIYFYGITLRISGSTSKGLTIGLSSDSHLELENCYLWLGTTQSTQIIALGATATGSQTYSKYTNCTFRFAATGQSMRSAGMVEFENCSIAAAGSVPTTLFTTAGNGAVVRVQASDLSNVTGTLVGSQGTTPVRFEFIQCKLGAAVTMMATQTPANKSSAQVFVSDCSDGDNHGLFGYYDAFGSVVSNTGTYLTAGAAAQSWQITTTANCSFGTPFVTPWIDLYNTGTSAVTPELELLRNNGTATTYTDAEVWGEFAVKTTASSTQSSLYTDRQALVDWAAGTAGSTAGRTGVGTGSWTIGASNSPQSFIVDSGAAVTPAENGAIRARVAVGLASVSNLFLDPQIRT